MKKIIIPILLTFFLLVAQVSAVGMFLNWPDGTSNYEFVNQGNDISFNYESFDFNEEVTTEVVLINSNNPGVPVLTFVDQVDPSGTFGFIAFPTDDLPSGDYAILGTATTDIAVSVDELEFTLEPNTNTNTAPYFDFGIPDYFEYPLSDESDTLLNLAQYANDDEGDLLSYTLDQTNTDTSVVDCNLFFESTLFCNFVGVGITTVDVIVSDGELSTSHTITIVITDDGNNAPYFLNVPSPFTYEIDIANTDVVQLSDYAVDVDGNALSYSVSGGDMIVSCNVLPDSTLNCDLLNLGSGEITVVASDGELQGTDTITINVINSSANNTAPFFIDIPTYFEYPVSQGTADLMDISDYAFDMDGDEIIYSLTESIPGIICYLVDDSIIRCDFTQVTSGNFDVTISDGEFSLSQEITIVITNDPVENNAPFWSGLAFNYIFNLDEENAIVESLNDFAFDIDGDSLSFILDDSQTDSDVLNCFINSNNDLFCVFNGVGTTTLDVIVSDGELSDTQTLTIQVVDENNPPLWDDSLELEYTFDIDESPAEVFDALDFVSDPDGDVLDIALDESSTDLNIINCFLSGSDETLVCLLNNLGTTTVNIIASDDEFNIPITVTINVIDNGTVNTAPEWNSSLDLFYSFDIDESPVQVFDVLDFVTDAQGDNIEITLDESDTNFAVLNCFLSGSDETLVCLLNGLGTTTLELVASDGEFDVSVTVVIQVTDDNEVNNPPVWSNSLDLFYSFDVDESPVQVFNAQDFVSDLDGDQVDIVLDESGTDFGVVNCFLSGPQDTLVCLLNGVGTTTLELVASDGEFSVPITVVIGVTDENANTAPQWDDSLDLFYSFDVDESPVNVVDLINFASDPDGDSLLFTLDESNTDLSIINCFLSGSDETLVCLLNGVGTTTLDVIVSDGEFDVSVTVVIEVTDENANTAPVWSDSLDLFYSFDVDESPVSVVDLVNFVSDPDGDSLSFTLDESNTDLSIINCFLSGSDETLVCLLNGLGTTTLEVIASDGQVSVPVTIVIEVTDEEENTAPQWDDNLDLFYSYDIDESPVQVFDAQDFVSDAQGDSISIVLDESGTDFGVLNCFLSGSDDSLLCLLNGLGTTTVELIASDGEFDVTITVVVQVIDDNEVNNPPVWSDNLDLFYSYDVDESPVQVVDLANFVSDFDGDQVDIVLDESGTDFGVVNCFLSGPQDTLVCLLNGLGTTTLELVASDGEFDVSVTVVIQVTDENEVNNPPVWSDSLDLFYSFDVDESPVSVVDLVNFVSDPDGDSLSFTLDESNTDLSIINCFLSGSDETLVCLLNGVGTTTLDVIVSDGEFDVSVTVVIEVTDENANTAPVWSNSLDLFYSFDVDESPVNVVSLQNFVSDFDGDQVDIVLDESGTDFGVVNCFLSGPQDTLVCLLNGLGTTTLELVASDGDLETSITVIVEVTDDVVVNNPPVWDVDLPDYFEYSFDLENVVVMNLANYASDLDGDDLFFSLDQSDTNFGVVDCTIQSGSILNCNLNGVGTTTLDVIVSDGELFDVETIIIQVVDDVVVNNPPVWNSSLDLFYSYDIEESPVQVVNLQDYVTDLDGDDIILSLDESNTNFDVMNCFISSNDLLVCLLDGVGTTVVDVIASDDEFSIPITIIVEVYADVNAPPNFVNLSLDYSYNLNLENVNVVDLAQYVVDPENDELAFSLDDSNTNPAIVDCFLITNSLLNCNLEGIGTTEIDVVVSDGENILTASLSITVFEDPNTPPYFDVSMPTFFSYPLNEEQVTLLQVSDYALDSDGDALSYQISQSNTDFDVINCMINSQSVISCNLNGVGVTTLDVVVSDGEFTILETLTVEVYMNNTEPYFDVNIPTYFEYNLSLGQADLFDVIDYVYDAQGDQLFISIDTTQTDADVISCMLLPTTTITCDFIGSGVTVLDVVVSDGEFTISQTVMVNILDDIQSTGPVAIITADGARNIVGTPFNFNGLSSFTSEGDSIVFYNWVIRDQNNVAIALFEGPVQSYTFNTQDEYSIELTVTDTQGLIDMDTFVMQSRWGKVTPEYDSENGLFINSLEIWGTGFEQVEENGEILVVATIENVGDRDFENVRMVFTIPELGWKIKSNAIDLRDGERKTIQIFDYLPDYVLEGHYYPVVSFSDTDFRRSKPLYLEVSE